ncbi:zinc finger protein CONSTANS-LIKE 14-like [Vigna umbellata]|uniref:zinc finger protein CONSTANS-LIKE 14-like n=1 Tax=Vigna umbellata TaxID=87088 RepID=UPI001F5E8D99|nr:zinc finger protein CONSTANS-LIKE 14-like [Vigna umbellata]
MLPCDYCHTKPALLFCRPDSAKLCLLCDHHVHTANALSLKHVRFQICDTCNTDTATVRCSAHNLILCHACDLDAHAHAPASLHHRHRLLGLSGCPSLHQIATALGLDLRLRHANCRDEVYEQFLEVARTRNENEFARSETEEFRLESENDVVDEMLLQQTPFTSLLGMPDSQSEFDAAKTNDNGYGAQVGDLLWTFDPNYQPPQVWDFELQKSRGCDEPGVVTFDGLEVPKLFQDVHNMNYSTTGDDILSRNNQSDQSSSSHAKKKEESNKKARGGLSSESKLLESIPYSDTNNVVVMEHLVGGNANVSTLKARVSVEELAKNRGNAMLRYKEKKKSRRYISFFI